MPPGIRLFFGSIVASEKTAAAAGSIGELRRDPMAMLPFCGCNMTTIGNTGSISAPKRAHSCPIFYVNWFRKDEEGGLWPGFGENSRVLEWIFKRCEGTADAIDTPIGGYNLDGLNFDGLSLSDTNIATLLKVDIDGWQSELPLIEDYYKSFGDRVPAALYEELKQLEVRLIEASVGVA